MINVTHEIVHELLRTVPLENRSKLLAIYWEAYNKTKREFARGAVEGAGNGQDGSGTGSSHHKTGC